MTQRPTPQTREWFARWLRRHMADCPAYGWPKVGSDAWTVFCQKLFQALDRALVTEDLANAATDAMSRGKKRGQEEHAAAIVEFVRARRRIEFDEAQAVERRARMRSARAASLRIERAGEVWERLDEVERSALRQQAMRLYPDAARHEGALRVVCKNLLADQLDEEDRSGGFAVAGSVAGRHDASRPDEPRRRIG